MSEDYDRYELAMRRFFGLHLCSKCGSSQGFAPIIRLKLGLPRLLWYCANCRSGKIAERS